MSVFISTLFYRSPILFVLDEINYFLIIGGYILFIFSIFNYKGYEYSVDFSQIREITATINAAIFMLVISIIVLFIFQIEIPGFITVSAQIAFSLSMLIMLEYAPG